MDTINVKEGRQVRASPYTVAVMFQVVIFGLYGYQFLPFGVLGIAAGALVGLLWALGLGFAARRLGRREEPRRRLANAAVFLNVIAIGLLVGGGGMYMAMMFEVLEEPSLTYAVLSALMQPSVPFFIIINSLMELFLVSLAVYWNWSASPGRRAFVLAGALAYLVMRIWTYLVYAEARLEISQQPLSQADVQWFIQTLENDFRIVLNIFAFLSFLSAAFLPARAETEA